MGLVCFRYSPEGIEEINKLNQLNESLMDSLNSSGKLYLTHTKVKGLITLRMVIGQTNVTWHHINRAWELIKEKAAEI
jgi:aromatic-L-amino-acid decarboxylase